MYNPNRNFKGYRSHPIYLEKVNNFMVGIRSKARRQGLEGDVDTDSYESSSSQDPYGSRRQLPPLKREAPAPSRSVNSRQTQSRQTAPSQQSSRTNGFQPESSRQASSGNFSRTSAAAPKKISSSDLRNKQSAVSNNQYSGVGQTAYTNFRQQSQPSSGSFAPGGQRKGPSYRVNLSIASGSFQADQY